MSNNMLWKSIRRNREARCKKCKYFVQMTRAKNCMYYLQPIKFTPKVCEYLQRKGRPKMKIALAICLIIIFVVGCIMVAAAGK